MKFRQLEAHQVARQAAPRRTALLRTAQLVRHSQGTADATNVSAKCTPKVTSTSGASQVSCGSNNPEADEYDECRERVEILDEKDMDEEGKLGNELSRYSKASRSDRLDSIGYTDLCDCCVTYMFSSQPATYRSSMCGHDLITKLQQAG